MSTSVTLPALGESVTEGTVTRWLKQVGDAVEADEPLLEVSTDKVDTEIPSPVAGVLLEIKAAEDETVEVGGELAVIGDAEEGAGGDSGDDEAAAEAAPEPEPEPSSEADEPRVAEASSSGPAAGTSGGDSGGGSGSGGGGGSGTEVTLPALGESVTEGTVSRWLKQVGDSVEADEALLEISTDKVDTEIPSPVAGNILEIKVGEDETVEVGAVLAVIGDASQASAPEAEAPSNETAQVDSADTIEEQTAAGDEGGQEPIPAQPEQGKAEPEPAATSQAPESQAQESQAQESHAPDSGEGDRSYVTPLVRKLAAEHNVDLASVKGTGVGGRIRKQDVLAAAEETKKAAEETKKAAEAPAAAPAAAASTPAPAAKKPTAEPSTLRGTTEKMSRLRKIIAARMVESLQVSAQLTAAVEVDLTEISKVRAKAKDAFRAREGVGLSYLPFITAATIEALKAFPKVNATIDTEAGEITYPSAEHVGIAVDTPRGLLVPVIKDAGDLNVGGLAKRIADLAVRTRDNKVTPDELSGGTFTITNYGSVGTLFDTPVINQPQVGILGTGALVKRPVVIKDPNLGEVIAVRDMMYLSLSYDHRIVDGADAARFLSTVKARLEEGDFGSEFGV